MAKNVVLVGLMGAGKTSVGKLLAQKYSKDFIDIDVYIEEQEKTTISDIFSKYGEKKFREIEKNVILKISGYGDNIISTGGGALENEDNIKNLQNNGVLIYLKASPKTLFERVKKQNHRPLLQNNDPLETLCKLLEKREKNYLKADIVIDTDNKQLEEIVDEIGELCKL